MTTKIEWTRGDDGSPGETWNPVTGCSKVSQGCKNCYAERLAPRVFAGQMYSPPGETVPTRPRVFTDVLCHPERLDAPLRWRKPRRVFVNSMSDLFHEDVPDDFIAKVFEVMNNADWHIYQVLTKRPQRMLAMLSDRTWPWACTIDKVPQSNVWLGVSIEDQVTANERIPLLLQTPAAVRFLSCEPLLGPVDLSSIKCVGADSPFNKYALDQLDWVIAGGESGPKARPMHIEWARSIVRQCKVAGVPVFMKQLGARTLGWCLGNGHGESEFYVDCKSYEASEQNAPCPTGYCACRLSRKGADPDEFPKDLRVREYPA